MLLSTRSMAPAAALPLLRRALHIVQAPTNPSLASITDNIPRIENATSESQQPVFNVLGTPGSILQVSLPPSTPLYAKRKSLLSISTPASTSGSADGAEPAETKIFSTLQCLSLGSVYQRLTSTVPLSLTLSAPAASGASIAVVELNGTVDWWVNGRYRHILAFASTPASTLTVTGRGTAKSRITGRGIVALSARSLNIFRVGLAPGESFLVRRAALLGYSIDDPFQTRVTYDDTISTAANASTALEAAANLEHAPVGRFREILNGLWTRTKSAVSWLNRNNEFVKVHGPATLLVDSSAAGPASGSGSYSPVQIKLGGSVEREIAKALVQEQAGGAVKAASSAHKDDPKLYLKYVNIGGDGKATFESTSTFKDFKA